MIRDMTEKENKENREDRERLLDVCKMAYRKHVLNDDSVGWNQLSDALAAVLSDQMGDKEFVRWLDEMSPGKPIVQ